MQEVNKIQHKYKATIGMLSVITLRIGTPVKNGMYICSIRSNLTTSEIEDAFKENKSRISKIKSRENVKETSSYQYLERVQDKST